VSDRTATEVAATDDAPLRAELLSVERLAERARVLAADAETRTVRLPRVTPLKPLLERIGSQLAAVNADLATGARDGRSVSPAMEWLLDNYYLVEDQVRTASTDLPAGYGAELPRLTRGPLSDYPRVYQAAVTLLAHTDARIEPDYLLRFVMAYQEVAPLTIGEVWAIPIMLRVALAEDLRRLASGVHATFLAEEAAERWADRLLTTLEEHPEDLAGVLTAMTKGQRRPSPSFTVRLSQRIADQERDVSAIADWIDRATSTSGVGLDVLAQSDHQRQAADQVSIANAITSIRFVDSTDWRAFFEHCSLVEAELRRDPAGVYGRMDFLSRDRYRHALEVLARRSPVDEVGVAQVVTRRAFDALHEDPTDLVRGHVGHYLISGGRYEVEAELSYRPRAREHAHRSWLSYRGLLYWGSLLALTTSLAASLGIWAVSAGGGIVGVGVLVLLSLLPLSELAIGVVNRLASVIWPPRGLSKLDYEQPIDEAHRTLVTVPALLTSPESVRHIIDALEVHHLGNRDENIAFALLGDLKGAQEEHAPGDAAIIEAATSGIAELNRRYGREGNGPFHLFLRSRSLDPVEETWMGWERKRGALTELARLLRGATDTTITLQTGDASFLAGVTFVITLDADTVLPRDSARKMVSAIAHPLNRARIDVDARRVRGGYGLVQPRVGMSLVSATETVYAMLHTGPTGLDPYAGAVSDTYQDVFGEGSFTGKGIFEVDVFNAVLEGRFPENRLLSHDLIEGCFLRTALASDIEVLDDFPGSYLAQCSRVHRWVRGDWQILPWLFRTAPGEGGERYRNPLTPLHRWKIVDNLRRSLFPVSWLLLGTAGWLCVPRPGWALPAALLLILVFPALVQAFDSLARFPRGVGLLAAVRPVLTDLRTDLLRAFVAFSLLPHQAALNADAATRALWRSWVSHRRMLEWTTAAEAARLSGSDLSSFGRAMLPSAVVATALLAPVVVAVPGSHAYIAPAAVAWLFSPLLAWGISRPSRRAAPEASPADVLFERRAARRTWRFFETFVTGEDHWLAPDNFQEEPKGEIAHRTSPTNMGLQLIADLTAHDLGYLSIGGLVDRTSRTLTTMVGLERFHGHFYNWYDTLSLQPLQPRYVSTVDSGNLAGHLLALRSGLLEMSEGPLIGPQALGGMADALRIALEDLLDEREMLGPLGVADPLRRQIEELLRHVELAEHPRNAGGWLVLLDELWRTAAPIEAAAGDLGLPDSRAVASVLEAVEAVRRHRDDLLAFAPWAHALAETPHAVPGWTRAYDLAPLLSATPSLAGIAEGLHGALAALDALAADPHGSDDEERAAVAAWARILAGATTARRARISSRGCVSWPRSRGRRGNTPTSGCCSTPGGSCSRSGSTPSRVSSTGRTTTCWRPSAGSPPTSRSRAVRCLRNTGSGSGAS
jgi:cyclic beta-1,2-glucan synthetase